MKLADAAREWREGSESSVKETILRFFIARPDEVFRRRDVVRELHGKVKSANSVRALILKLYEEEKIDRVQRTTATGSKIGYYGTKGAVAKLRNMIKE
jgi:hypothetical protein